MTDVSDEELSRIEEAVTTTSWYDGYGIGEETILGLIAEIRRLRSQLDRSPVK